METMMMKMKWKKWKGKRVGVIIPMMMTRFVHSKNEFHTAARVIFFIRVTHISKIVPHLLEGAGVVTSRGDVHFVVTEFGVAYLHGKSLRERAEALIEIAHPDFREDLERFAKEKNII